MSNSNGRFGVVRYRDLVKALIKLGGNRTYKGGETIIKFYYKEITDRGEFRRSAPAIIIGRNDFCDVMLKKRVFPSLIAAGIHPDALYNLLRGKKR